MANKHKIKSKTDARNKIKQSGTFNLLTIWEKARKKQCV